MLKVGVIGAGTMGSAHAGAYASLAETELVGVCDVRQEAASRVAQATGSKVVSAEELFDDPEVDLIDVCVPTPFHKEFVMRAARAKKHIFCEKPLARTLKDGEEMVRAAEEAGVKFGVGHVVRFFPEYLAAKRAIEAGRIGKPGVVRTFRGGGGFPLASQDWYANYEWSGGLTLDMIIHDFDFLRWVFGDVQRVFAKATTFRDYNRIEHVFVTLRFVSGVIAMVEGSWANLGGFSYGFEIAGDAGLIHYDSRDIVPLRSVTTGGPGGGGVPVPESTLEESPYVTEIKDFVGAIIEGRAPTVDGREALATLRIALAALESIEKGIPVDLC